MRVSDNLSFLVVIGCVWAFLTLAIVIMVVKVMAPKLASTETDWIYNIITLFGMCVTAGIMGVSVYYSSKHSSDQIQAIHAQMSHSDRVRKIENREESRRALMNIEHYFESYTAIYFDLNKELPILKNRLKKLNKKNENYLLKVLGKLSAMKYQLPSQTEDFNRLSPELIQAYRKLVRHDREIERNLEIDADFLGSRVDVKNTILFLEKTHFEIGNYFRDIAYEIERQKRELYELDTIVSINDWTAGFFIIEHANGLAIETTRHPRMKIWTKEKLELRKYDFTEETVSFEYELLEKPVSELEKQVMKRCLGKIMSFNLSDKGVKKFTGRKLASKPKGHHEYMWQ
ncbi:hypothetical protein FUAX_04660 [Fulvitalea axinellae]|uniref:Phage abortive infection protein n=1 Tax=Fulvitalea axinellae TaxID=1182444 RepID=A0AAU9CNV9_9BACT|nr:hypothetical protein FUAX_04660 [Fulvitalea axinellae]